MDLLSDQANFSAKVSSVLNKNVKEFGKKFLFDGREDTCWNSDQGTPQFISISFAQPQKLSSLQIQFQGGFVGKSCQVLAPGTQPEKLIDIYPEDSNKLQTFALDFETPIDNIKIVFSESTDFFGRITIYQLKLFS